MSDIKKLTPRSQDQAQWYQEVVVRAKLADYSPVRGSMVIRPYGYAIWEAIQQDLNQRIKAAGVQNAYFPLFIPYSFLEQEANHVEGFAPEVAVVTHAGGKELEEKLVVRPTSETIIYRMFSEWIQSYRDLPLKINQWANVVRWEKRTNPFLRTTEFLWQEGHTIHANKQEAWEEMERALNMYHDFAREVMAMPTIKGYKTEAEKFPGADTTTTIEGMMKDKKALQSGTSHTLSQGFTKSFNVNFVDENGDTQTAWATSWGFSTRVIGGLIMMHGDDKGLVLPPRLAPVKAIIIPIVKGGNDAEVEAHVQKVEALLTEAQIAYEVDRSDNAPGFKFSEAELRGIPLRLEIGGKDVESDSVMLVKRNDSQKESVGVSSLTGRVNELMDVMQTEILEAAERFTADNTHDVSSAAEFYQLTESEEPVGYIRAFFSGDKELEAEIKEKTKYTTRCIPFASFDQAGECIFSGKPGKLTLFARAY